MRKWGVACVWCLLACRIMGQPLAALEQLLATPGLEHASVGIAVERVADGKSIVEHQSAMALTPASVTKLLPTFWALRQKGGDFRFKTVVAYTGMVRDGVLSGDLVVVAGGDPTIESRYFPSQRLIEPIADTLERLGISRIVGCIRVEGARDGTDIPGSWPWEDVSNYYAASYLPFNYRDNTCTFRFRTGTAGEPAILETVEPALPGIELVNQVVASDVNEDRAWVYGGPYSKQLCIRGTLPKNRVSFSVKGAMHCPAQIFANELACRLAARGIAVENGEPEQEQRRTELLILQSPPLERIAYHTNKSSINLFAEALGSLVAPKDWQGEVSKLLQEAGIPADGVDLKDACGLSPTDAVPASVFTALLVYASKSGEEAFELSLPEAGKDRGLNGYCAGASGWKGRMRAKTGSMTGVRCLAGYLDTDAGERFAFTVLVNRYACPPAQLQLAVGRFLQALL